MLQGWEQVRTWWASDGSKGQQGGTENSGENFHYGRTEQVGVGHMSHPVYDVGLTSPLCPLLFLVFFSCSYKVSSSLIDIPTLVNGAHLGYETNTFLVQLTPEIYSLAISDY